MLNYTDTTLNWGPQRVECPGLAPETWDRASIALPYPV